MTRRTFCIDLEAEDLDDVQLHDLHRRMADAVSYLGYVSLVDVSELPPPLDADEDDYCWGV